MKVDICEAGFAASSEGDFQCVSQIAELAKDMSICTLARSTLTDIDRAGEALRGVARATRAAPAGRPDGISTGIGGGMARVLLGRMVVVPMYPMRRMRRTVSR